MTRMRTREPALAGSRRCMSGSRMLVLGLGRVRVNGIRSFDEGDHRECVNPKTRPPPSSMPPSSTRLRGLRVADGSVPERHEAEHPPRQAAGPARVRVTRTGVPARRAAGSASCGRLHWDQYIEDNSYPKE